MAAAIGWYGPLIDLSRASSHVGDFVQLIVFVHGSQKIEKDFAFSRRPISKTDIQVGDDTRPYFLVSVWHKHIETMLVPGDIILLQNSYQLIAPVQLGRMAKEKYSRVLYWIQHTESAMLVVQKKLGRQNTIQISKNWKLPEDQNPNNCSSISDVLCCKNSCKMMFYAFIGKIVLPYSLRYDKAQEQLSLKKSLLEKGKIKIAEDFVCVGCMKCGFPVDSMFPLYCSNSSNYIHAVGLIYRPFLVHVGDHTGIIPLLVKNSAATILFGKITAEHVHKCCRKASQPEGGKVKPNLYHIWLILLNVLLQKQESPFQFEVNVDMEKIIENGRFELIFPRMPCYIK